MSDINTILNACELVWRQQSVGSTAITDMRNELESHLVDAQSAGKPAESVVGSNIERFARSWAGTQPARVIPSSLAATQSEREARADASRMRLYISIGAIVVITLLGLVLAPAFVTAGTLLWLDVDAEGSDG